jgi:hypothetical protein
MAKDEVKDKTNIKDGDGKKPKDYDKIERLEGLPAEYQALFGKEGSDLSEVTVLTPRQAWLDSLEVMQEELANPDRIKRVSQILREARHHNYIAVGGQGRKDIHLIAEKEAERKAVSSGDAFGRL